MVNERSGRRESRPVGAPQRFLGEHLCRSTSPNAQLATLDSPPRRRRCPHRIGAWRSDRAQDCISSALGELGPCVDEIALAEARHSHIAARDRHLRHPPLVFRLAQEALRRLPRQARLAAQRAADEKPVIGVNRSLASPAPRPAIPCARERGLQLVGGEASRMHHRLTQAGLKLQPYIRRSGCGLRGRR